MKWNCPGHEAAVDILCDKNNKYYIWGIAETGLNFLKRFKNDIDIIGIIDSNEELLGETIQEYVVFRPEEVEFTSEDKVIVTINTAEYVYEVYKYLETKGLIENQTFFHYVTAQRILDYYCHNTLFLEQTDLALTSLCTLQCKDCLVQIPYIKKPGMLEWDEIQNRIDLSFKFVDGFGEYHLVGGEPTLSPEIEKTISYLQNLYGNRIEKICVVTNATVSPKENLLAELKRCSGKIIISDYSYSEAFNKTQKVEEWIKKSGEKGVELGIRKQGIWNLLGQEDKNDYSEDQLVKCFDFCDCGARKTLTFQNDRVYLCARSAMAEDWALSEIHEENSFLLGDVTEENRRKFLEYTMGYTNLGYLEQCKKCYLGKYSWETRIPAAKQVER